MEGKDKTLYTCMFGFGPQVQTHEIFLQHKDEEFGAGPVGIYFEEHSLKVNTLKKEEIIHTSRSKQIKVIPALTLKGAFANVRHKIIFNNLQNLNCGERTYTYIC